MTTAVFNPADFEPLLRRITNYSISLVGNVWVEISIPSIMAIDIERVQSVFDHDAELSWTRRKVTDIESGYYTSIKGTIRDTELSRYIADYLLTQ